MKKIFAGLISAAVIFVVIVFYGANNTQAKGDIMDKKILTVYFSLSGNTKYIAEKIKEKTGGDIFEITPKTPYPANYNETVAIAKKQKEENFMPELKNHIDIKDYDTIFIGTPAWWYTMAPPVISFLKENDFTGKTIAPFITHGGGGGYRIAEEMKKYSNAKEVTQPLIIYERGNSGTDKEISNWLNSILN